MIRAVLPALVRPLVEPHLPDDIDAQWFMSSDEAVALAPHAEIGWFDMMDKSGMPAPIKAATALKWLHSLYSGVDGMPLDALRERGTVFTNGAGLLATPIAEYVVMGMLNIAKGYREVVRAQDRHEWLMASPGTAQLLGSRALLIGYGAIGREIETRLRAFGVSVAIVRRSPEPGMLGPDEWRARLNEFDWVILALPATAETEHMIGATELAAMKPGASLVNISRGSIVDQDALTEALKARTIGAAFLDVTTPEPLPADHTLWSLDNAHITMHLSGRAQSDLALRAAERFLDNLARYRKGEPLSPVVDMTRGY